MDSLWFTHFVVLTSAARIFLTGAWKRTRRSFLTVPNLSSGLFRPKRHQARLALLVLVPVLLVPPVWSEQWQRPSGETSREVTVNGTRLTEQTLSGLERLYRVRIMSGDYWYDRIAGAWGVIGGPTAGFILPNLNLGGPLRANASNGNTGVFVNGRQLHILDVLALQQITTVLPGRFWVNAQGYGGYEGGPAFFNLVQLAQAAGGKRGGAWSYTSKYTGASVGGDGNFFYFIDKDSSYTSSR